MTTTTTTTTTTLATATPHDVLRLVTARAEADGNAAVLSKIERGVASPEDRARASTLAERALGAERLRRAAETGELPPRSVIDRYPKREQVERWPFAGDLDWSEAVGAFSGTSHVPEQRAAGTFWDYAAHMQKMRGLLGDDFEAYRAGYLPRFRAWLRSRANVVSTMIAGGSGFNVRRAEKRSATADNRWNDVDAYHQAFLKRRAREQVAARRGAGGVVGELRAEIERLEREQEAMKAVNAEIRKLKVMPTTPADINTVAALIEGRTGMAAADVAKALVPDFAGRVGFPSYALSNNNANIKRKRERLVEEEAKAVRAADTGEDFTREVTVNGGVVSVRYNREEDRLQLDFPKGLIPESDLSGWNRAYTLGVWQRQLTDNAVMSANRILSKAGATERLPTLAESLAARAPVAPAAVGAELTAEDEAAADADAAALVAQAGLVEPEAGEEPAPAPVPVPAEPAPVPAPVAALTAADINMPPKSVYPRQELPYQTTDRLGIPYSLIRPYVGRRVVLHAPAARRFRGDFDEYGGLDAELLPPLGLDTWGDPGGINPSVRLPAFGPSGRLVTRSEDSPEVPAIEQDTNDPRMGFWSIVTLEPNKIQPTDVWVWRGLPPTYEAFAVGYYHGLVGKTPTPAYLQRVLGSDAEHTGGYGDGLHMGKQHRAAWIKAGRKPVPVKRQGLGQQIEPAAEPASSAAPAPAPAPVTYYKPAQVLDIEALDVTDGRKETLRIARGLGVDDDVLLLLAGKRRVSRQNSIILPAKHIYPGGRGEGFARLEGSRAGEEGREGVREGGGFRVERPGDWVVWSKDGGKKETERWTVEQVVVGPQVWMIAY